MPKRLGDVGGAGHDADLHQVLAISRGELGVIPALGAVAPAGEPVQPALRAPDERPRTGTGDQQPLDAQLVDGALDGLLGDAELRGQ